MLDDLKELIAIRSVMDKPGDGAPFGRGPREALDKFLSIAAGYGMKTRNENGYCGWAEIGNGKDMLGILGHLDVVPEGDGWSHDPYSMVVEDGLIKGRGVADDKGPTVAALHAMKRIAENGAKLNHRIRLIVGCNEENGSQCIEYYRDHCEIPKASFVPDADFPVINSEKGILHLVLDIRPDEYFARNILNIRAGERPNIVPDLCIADIPKGCELYEKFAAAGKDSSLFLTPRIAAHLINNGMRTEDFSVHYFEDKLTVEARGVAGHAMAPDKGENAAMKIIALLDAMSDGKSETLVLLKKYLCAPNPANDLGIAKFDEVSGELTVNLGMINLIKRDETALRCVLDCRLPVCADHNDVVKTIAEKFKNGKLAVDRWSPNLYVPKDSKLVKALLSAYAKTAGGKTECLYCGGGTYARELPNAVAFGPTFPGLETNIHNVDESFPLELFEKLPDIYCEAILTLDKEFAE